MTATTARYGLVYPSATDALANADDTAKANAEQIDVLLGSHGTASVTVLANTNTTVSVAYTGGVVYPTAPLTCATLNTAAPNGFLTIWTTGHTTSGFVLGVRSAVAGTYSVNWHAHPVQS